VPEGFSVAAEGFSVGKVRLSAAGVALSAEKENVSLPKENVSSVAERASSGPERVSAVKADFSAAPEKLSAAVGGKGVEVVSDFRASTLRRSDAPTRSAVLDCREWWSEFFTEVTDILFRVIGSRSFSENSQVKRIRLIGKARTTRSKQSGTGKRTESRLETTPRQ
jgi:hypothetical protein